MTATEVQTAEYRTVRDGADRLVVFYRFPAGLERFGRLDWVPTAEKGRAPSGRAAAVFIRCPRGEAGYDFSPLFTAADWCRDQGWIVRRLDKPEGVSPSQLEKFLLLSPLPHDPLPED